MSDKTKILAAAVFNLLQGIVWIISCLVLYLNYNGSIEGDPENDVFRDILGIFSKDYDDYVIAMLVSEAVLAVLLTLSAAILIALCCKKREIGENSLSVHAGLLLLVCLVDVAFASNLLRDWHDASKFETQFQTSEHIKKAFLYLTIAVMRGLLGFLLNVMILTDFITMASKRHYMVDSTPIINAFEEPKEDAIPWHVAMETSPSTKNIDALSINSQLFARNDKTTGMSNIEKLSIEGLESWNLSKMVDDLYDFEGPPFIPTPDYTPPSTPGPGVKSTAF